MTLSSLPNLRSRRAVSEQNRLVEVWRQPATGAAGGGVASYCSPFVARNAPDRHFYLVARPLVTKVTTSRNHRCAGWFSNHRGQSIAVSNVGDECGSGRIRRGR